MYRKKSCDVQSYILQLNNGKGYSLFISNDEHSHSTNVAKSKIDEVSIIVL